MDAAFYHCENFQLVRQFIQQLEDDSAAIEVAKEIFEVQTLSTDLATIKSNFKVLRRSITRLEERLPLRQALEIVNEVRESLTIPKFSKKLEDTLAKNPGFNFMAGIGDVLSGKHVEDVNVLSLDPDVIATSVVPRSPALIANELFQGSTISCSTREQILQKSI